MTGGREEGSARAEVIGAGDRFGPQEAAEGEELFDDEAAAMLGASLRPVEPPAGLRACLLAAVASESPARGAAAPAGTVGPAGAAADAAPPEPRDESSTGSPGGAEPPGAVEPAQGEGATVVPLAARRRRRGAWLLRAAAVLVLISAGFGAGRWSAMDSMEDTEHYAHLNQAQDVQRVTDTMADGHVATLTWSQDMSMTALSLPSAMMPQAGDQSLQVWLRDGDQTTSLGVYDPDSGTGFSFLDVMPEPGQEVLITLEPAGGSDQPTTAPLVVLHVGAPGAQST